MVPEWTLAGVPTSAGAHHAGQERAPAALREAGLLDRLTKAGVRFRDGGDLPVTPFAVDREQPESRNLAAVVAVARRTAELVADILATGSRPLLIGGDCTITLGAVAGFRRAGADAGLVYVDGDADVSVPGHGSGILDSTGIALLLGAGRTELTTLAGTAPLISADRLALVGADPREVGPSDREFLADHGARIQYAPDLAADPVRAAERALADAGDGPVLVHLDVDVTDSADLPLANFPHYGSGVTWDAVTACLRALLRSGWVAGLVLTEVNPTHDTDGSQLERYIAGITEALADERVT